jgi:hypothetical protein
VLAKLIQFSVQHKLTKKDLIMAIKKLGFVKPVRITITVPNRVFAILEEQSYIQGRSLSNFAAVTLEKSLLKDYVNA